MLYARLVPTSVGGGGYVRVTAASIPPFLPPPSHSRCLSPPFVPIPTSQILHVSTRRGKDAAVVFNAELCGSLMDPRRSDFGAYCDLKCCMGPTSAYHIACYFQIYAAAYTRTRAGLPLVPRKFVVDATWVKRKDQDKANRNRATSMCTSGGTVQRALHLCARIAFCLPPTVRTLRATSRGT